LGGQWRGKVWELDETSLCSLGKPSIPERKKEKGQFRKGGIRRTTRKNNRKRSTADNERPDVDQDETGVRLTKRSKTPRRPQGATSGIPGTGPGANSTPCKTKTGESNATP